MASSGTINNTFRTGYAVRVVWNIDSQAVANNTTTVTAKVQLVSLGSSYIINSTATKNGSLTINGAKYNFTFTAALSGNQTKTLYTKTVVVPHNTDGTKTCSFVGVAGIDVTLSGVKWTSVTAEGTGVFDSIARASNISSVTSSVSVNGTNAVAVNITRASSSFTHSVVYKFGSYSQTQSNVATSTSFVIPTSWLNAIPNATSGTANVTVTTYSGTTKIGSAVSRNFALTVPSSVVPSINSVTIAEAVSGIATKFGTYVQNKSRLAVSIASTGVFSSTIKAYRTTIDGFSSTKASFTSDVLKSSGTRTINITVTDSRGRTATATRNITVASYSPPTITTFNGFRALSNGTEDYDGTFLKANIRASISSVNNRNSNTYKLEYKLSAATTWTTLSTGTGYSINTIYNSTTGIFNADNSYDVRFSLTDYFGTVTQIFEVSTAFTLIDYNESGRAVAFGKVSELAEGIEFGIPVYFAYGESLNSAKELTTGMDLNSVRTAGFYVIPSGAISGTILNKPITGTATGFLTVRKGGSSGQTVQEFMLCDKIRQELFRRCYYSSAWGTWQKVDGGSRSFTITAAANCEINRAMLTKQSDIVTMFVNCDSTIARTAGTGFIIGTVPVDVRPANSVAGIAIQGTSGMGAAWIRNDGTINFRPFSAYSANTAIEFNLSWNVSAQWQ